MKEVIRHNDLNFDEYDVEEETDTEQLKYWLSEINVDITSIKNQIKHAVDNNIPSRDHFHKLTYIKRIYGLLASKICFRLSVLNKRELKKRTEAYLKKDSTKEMAFIRMTKRMLDKPTYLKIWNEVNLKLGIS